MIKISKLKEWPVTNRRTGDWEFIGAYGVKGDDFLPCIVLWYKMRKTFENSFTRFEPIEYNEGGQIYGDLNMVTNISDEIIDLIMATESLN